MYNIYINSICVSCFNLIWSQHMMHSGNICDAFVYSLLYLQELYPSKSWKSWTGADFYAGVSFSMTMQYVATLVLC